MYGVSKGSASLIISIPANTYGSNSGFSNSTTVEVVDVAEINYYGSISPSGFFEVFYGPWDYQVPNTSASSATFTGYVTVTCNGVTTTHSTISSLANKLKSLGASSVSYSCYYKVYDSESVTYSEGTYWRTGDDPIIYDSLGSDDNFDFSYTYSLLTTCPTALNVSIMLRVLNGGLLLSGYDGVSSLIIEGARPVGNNRVASYWYAWWLNKQ